MYVTRVISTNKKGGQTASILVRESVRVGKKVINITHAVLTHLPAPIIEIIESAVKSYKKSGADKFTLSKLLHQCETILHLRQAESFGAVFLIYQMAAIMGIQKALGTSFEAKLALWQVLARLMAPAVSLLAMVRMAGSCAASALLGLDEPFNEDDLYENGEWLVKRQSAVEAALWKHNPASADSSGGIFLYDVTSSYFEGEHNALAAFGYNRDKKDGKSQVVMGLLTDVTGEPISVSLFPGNTSDVSTVAHQVDKLKNVFGQKTVTLVGDRGMIRGPQEDIINAAGMYYIGALTKAEIATLLKADKLQMGLFDSIVNETILVEEVPDNQGKSSETSETKTSEGSDQCRTITTRIITRMNPIRRDEMAATRQKIRLQMEAAIERANKYLAEHPKARVSIQLRDANKRLTRGSLDSWMHIESDEATRTLVLKADEELLKEHVKLDGCYALKTDMPQSAASKEVVHERYGDLQLVERAFRTLKTGHLEMRPWHVITEDNTRAHALTAMLSLKIRRRLAQAWSGLDMTVEEGLTELGRWSVQEIVNTETGEIVGRILPEPTEIQRKLIEATGVKVPTKAPPAGPVVVTRTKLNENRKANLNN